MSLLLLPDSPGILKFWKYVIAFGLLWLSVCSLNAADFYVSTTGTDAGACTVGSPCASVSFALNLANSGDRIFILGHPTNTYSESNILIDESIEILGPETGDPAIFDGAGLSGADDRCFRINAVSINVSISNLTIQNYDVSNSGFTSGGGIRVYDNVGVTLRVDNCVFSGNNAGRGGGGGLFAENGAILVTNSLFDGNQSEGHGGGIRINSSATISIETSTISNNSIIPVDGTRSGGGLYYVGAGISSISQSYFYGNYSEDNGGAILSGGGELNLTNCVLYENISADRGAGIYYSSSNGNLLNCTFADNVADADASEGGSAGAIGTTGDMMATYEVNITNCIAWGNDNDLLGPNRDIRQGASGTNIINISYSNYQTINSITGTNESNLTADPNFQNAANDLYNLGVSPTTNMGTNTGAPSVDIVGNSRPYDDITDMGAWEFQGQPLPIELLYFRANLVGNEYVQLEFATSSESNNDFFTIQKSPNGSTFSDVARVDGAKNSNKLITYKTTDLNPLPGQSYYRLKQTDFDGQFSFSKWEIISNNTGFSNPIIYPNPVINILTISDTEQDLFISLYNQTGKQILRSYVEKTLDLTDVKSGTYLLKLVWKDGRKETHKVVKK